MNLKDFEQIIHIKSEIIVLSKRLSKAKSSDIVTDCVKDYKRGYGRIVAITGYEVKDTDKINKINDMLEKRKSSLELKIYEAEIYIDSIPDSKIRTLMTLRYLEGKEWDEVAKTFYKKMTADAARKAIFRYFENT